MNALWLACPADATIPPWDWPEEDLPALVTRLAALSPQHLSADADREFRQSLADLLAWRQHCTAGDGSAGNAPALRRATPSPSFGELLQERLFFPLLAGAGSVAIGRPFPATFLAASPEALRWQPAAEGGYRVAIDVDPIAVPKWFGSQEPRLPWPAGLELAGGARCAWDVFATEATAANCFAGFFRVLSDLDRDDWRARRQACAAAPIEWPLQQILLAELAAEFKLFDDAIELLDRLRTRDIPPAWAAVVLSGQRRVFNRLERRLRAADPAKVAYALFARRCFEWTICELAGHEPSRRPPAGRCGQCVEAGLIPAEILA